MMTKKCTVCGREYETSRRHSIYCSPGCNAHRRYETHRESILAKRNANYHAGILRSIHGSIPKTKSEPKPRQA